MSKLNKEEAARFSGAAWALRICEESGIEACRKEMEYRGILNIPLAVTKSQLDEAAERIKNNLMATVLILSLAALRDVYGFGAKRMNRFMDNFNLKAACLAEDYVLWRDIKKTLEEETGVSIPLPEEFMNMGVDHER